MTIYERIKERRKDLGLSADDVANALGISRATVYRYESSYIEKLPTSVLEPLAKVLKCSPSYLTGWSDDINSNNSFELSDTEKHIIQAYRTADNLTQAMVLRSLGLDTSLSEAEDGALHKCVQKKKVDFVTKGNVFYFDFRKKEY